MRFLKMETGATPILRAKLLAAVLMLQRGALRDGIVLLGVAGRNLLPVDAALEHFHRGRVIRRKLGQRLLAA